MEIYKSEYLHLAFFAEEELIEMTWLSSTNKMTEGEYKQEFLSYLDIILELCPKRIIADTSNSFFTIVPKLQDWTNEIIFKQTIAIGLNKAAFVVSQNIFTRVSIEQTMEETEGAMFITRYFDSKEEAKEWILSLK